MKLYRYFGIYFETDIENVRLEKDNRLFMDPYLLYRGKDELSQKGYQKVDNFFKRLLFCAKQNQDKIAYEMVNNLHEREETRLGYSLQSHHGNGFSKNSGKKIYEEIKENPVFQQGFIQDVFDLPILMRKVGNDRISDMITNIIFTDLLAFTVQQCEEYKIPMEEVNLMVKKWDEDKQKWENYRQEYLPIYKDKSPVVFVPKTMVTSLPMFSYEKVYRGFYLPYYEKQEQKLGNSKFLLTYQNGKQRINKKELKKQYPCNKEEIIALVQQHYPEYQDYKNSLLLK